jgi:hypothetical protein
MPALGTRGGGSAKAFGLTGATGYLLQQSLRLRSSASAYLTRTPTSTTTQRTWTWSAWVKRGSLDLNQVFTWYNTNFNYIGAIRFESNGTLNIYEFNITSSAFIWQVQTTQVFRDPASWYHIVVAYDSTQATATNRLKLYVNGSQVTAFGTTNYPTLNYQSSLNTNSYPNYIGVGYNGTTLTQYNDGYYAEINFIDGQQLTPSSFGQNDSVTGVWQPIKYAGTYGTNGYYLPFNTVSTSSYAAAFNGSQYVISPSAVNYNVTGDFTFETWVYFSSNPNNLTSKFIFDHRSSTGTGGLTLVQEGADNTWTAWNASNVFSGNTIVAGKWYHMAVSRQSGIQRVFLNGILTNTTADATTYNTDQFAIGVRYSGTFAMPSGSYLSNYRFVVGTALYTSNFTPSTVPLTSVTNTKLLTFQSSTIVDNSGLSNTLTVTGGLTTNVQYPFSLNVYNDQSSQSNNWTPSGISLANGITYDSMTDVPTLTSATQSNYSTLQQTSAGANASISNGGLTYNFIGSANCVAQGTMGMSSGKWYCEATANGTQVMVGISNGSVATLPYVGNNANSWGYYGNTGNRYTNNVNTAYGSTYTTGDIIGIAFDADVGSLAFYKNNVSQGAAYTGLTAGPYFVAVGNGNQANCSINFGQRPFSYTPPAGYVALNAYNLSTPTISAGNKYMDATIYTGTGTALTVANAGAFRPDFVWLKSRSNTYNHLSYNSTTGNTKVLYPNLTLAEETNADLTSFNSNGFTLGTGASTNANGATYVGWQWQAGQGSTSTNTSGTITSTVNVNTTAGFSIVTYTGTGVVGATVGHGLGVAPKLVITKRRSATENWSVTTPVITGSLRYAWLNLIDAFLAAGETSPTSTVFYPNNGTSQGASGSTYVAYCWAPIDGFSQIGIYTGNGSADGPFVYTGFRPRFYMFKRTDSAGNWGTFDTARGTYNINTPYLYPNRSDAEGSATILDFLSNGFKIRSASSADWNTAGGTYLYMAFAENPFKYALAR